MAPLIGLKTVVYHVTLEKCDGYESLLSDGTFVLFSKTRWVQLRGKYGTFTNSFCFVLFYFVFARENCVGVGPCTMNRRNEGIKESSKELRKGKQKIIHLTIFITSFFFLIFLLYSRLNKPVAVKVI